jgi:phosphoribosylglycinamide formyltransferase 2
LLIDDIEVRIFGKKEIHGNRRMGVILSKSDCIEGALSKSKEALKDIILDS